jgi:tRNA (guanine37-N1)-methyltransferase
LEYLKKAGRGFECIGDIAIIEGASKKRALEILEKSNKIKTVFGKKSSRQGVFRTRKLVWLAGKKNYTTIHVENGCRFFVDLRKDYFSSRLSFERMRIASQVKKNEKVLVLFAGVGPFAILCAKKGAKVTAVELNPHAVDYLKKNAELNKVDVECVLGDARDEIKKIGRLFNRILLPLPFGSDDFLPLVLKNSKKGCVIHFYTHSNFRNESKKKLKPFKDVMERIKKACKKEKVKCKILFKRVVGGYSPNIRRVVVDIKVS